MTNERFNFSPRFGLILANLKTVKEVKKVIEEESKIEIKRFLKHIQVHLKDKVPDDIQSWKLFMGKSSINIYPDDTWKVLDNDEITITIQLDLGMNILNSEYDPWVGLYVPENWQQKELFNEKLLKALDKGFMNEWDKPADNWPIWAYIKYEDYSKADNFDTEAFIDDAVELVSKLVKIKDKIDSVLKQIKQVSK